MDDINALNSKLQSISKALEQLQGAVVVQEEKIRRCVKEQRDNNTLRATLVENIKEEEAVLVKVLEKKADILAESDHLGLACDCLDASLGRLPHIVRKLCSEYERFSTKKGKAVRTICATLSSNGFWTQQTGTAAEKCSTFRNILRETKQSRGEFCSSEERRLRRELEVEESKLSYLEQCIRDAEGMTLRTPTARHAPVQVTPPPILLPPRTPQASKRLFCPPSSDKVMTPSPATRDPFADWEDRGSPGGNAGGSWSAPQQHAAPSAGDASQQNRGASAEAARKALFPGYKSHYPRQGSGMHEQDSGDGGENLVLPPHKPDGLSGAVEEGALSADDGDAEVQAWGRGMDRSGAAHSQLQQAQEVRVTISTTTVTERTVRTTGKSMSYATTTAAPARYAPSAFLQEDVSDSQAGAYPSEYSWEEADDAPLPSFQAPGVPWFREVKRRRVCAAPENTASAGVWGGGVNASFIAPSDPGEQMCYTPHSRQPLLLSSTAHSEGAGLGRFAGGTAGPGGREAEVVDLYDTSGSSDEETSSTARTPARTAMPRAVGVAVSGGRVTGSSPADSWSRQGSMQAPQAPMQKGPQGGQLKERFRTGLDLVQSSSSVRA